MLLGESRTWDEHHRAFEKNEYIPTDSESIRGARSENRPRGKIGVSGLTKPIIQWTLKPRKEISRNQNRGDLHVPTFNPGAGPCKTLVPGRY